MLNMEAIDLLLSPYEQSPHLAHTRMVTVTDVKLVLEPSRGAAEAETVP